MPSLNPSLPATSFSYDNDHLSLGIKIIYTLNTATHVGTYTSLLLLCYVVSNHHLLLTRYS